MRALVLAAGRGERMRPLTDATAKVLLEAGGRTLLAWQIARLAAAGISDIVVNTAWCAAQIEAAIGSGAALGARVRYSHEGTALETRGAIVRALPLLGDAPFAVVSGDIYTDFDYARLVDGARRLAGADTTFVAHLVLVDNPPYHAGGDMGLTADGRVQRMRNFLTFANIGVYHPRIFAGLPASRERLFPWLYQFADAGLISAEHFRGTWHNVGTPGDLAELRRSLGTA